MTPTTPQITTLRELLTWAQTFRRLHPEVADDGPLASSISTAEAILALPAPACKHCKWWGLDYANVCDRPTDARGAGGLLATAPGDVAIWGFAHDDSGLSTRLVTGPDFFCSQFCPAPQDPERASH